MSLLHQGMNRRQIGKVADVMWSRMRIDAIRCAGRGLGDPVFPSCTHLLRVHRRDAVVNHHGVRLDAALRILNRRT